MQFAQDATVQDKTLQIVQQLQLVNVCSLYL